MKVESSFHIKFRLQGNSFSSVEELIAFSKEISSDVYLFLKKWFNEESFVEVKTSGSTGVPKLIQLQKKHMINSAIATGNFFNLPENTTALLCMSTNYIAGKMMLVRALTLGWQLDIVEPSSNPLGNVDMEYDFSAMVPLQVSNSLKNIYKIKKLIIGGGAVSNELLAKIQHIETAVFATYGMTETITHIAVKKLNYHNNDSVSSKKIHRQAENEVNIRHAELGSASHYKILPNIKISKDYRGCLIINAPKISNEMVVTNDLVEIISETEFNWLGRFDSVINSGGIKLIPEQIEEKLSSIIKKRFFVAGIPDEVLGKKLVLVIEKIDEKILRQAQNDSSRSDLIVEALENLKNDLYQKIKNENRLSKYEIPKEIYFIKNFVETETQKINRKETLKLLKNIC